jgi:phage-related baseplate assembly protein
VSYTPSNTSTIDLSQLTPPDIIEVLNFEVIYAAMLAQLIQLVPNFDATVESDPAVGVLQVGAYEELNLRQRINDAVLAVLLSSAQGNDLVQVGANFDVPRLVVDPGDPEAIPPIPPTLEPLEDFRLRVQMSHHQKSTAGAPTTYKFFGQSADGDVRDIFVKRISPGTVGVWVLARSGNGMASPLLLDRVAAALSDDVRPLTDNVVMQSAQITAYQVVAELTLYPGPDAAVVHQAALAAVQAYTLGAHRIAYDIAISGLHAALHQPGVQSVRLITPAANIVVGPGQAAFCTGIAVTVAGATDV